MEACAAEAGGIERLQLAIGDRRRHQRNAAVGATLGRERIGGRGIVEAVRNRMDDDATFDAEKVVQRE
jgi:hypothetical protein